MHIHSNTSLKNHNSFGIDVKAAKFISVESVEDLKMILRKSYAEELFILGGGSNMLLTQDIQKTVIHINLKGKHLLKENEEEVYIEAMAGENWHEFVLWCLERDFGGLENLSLIPGNVGSAPIQNIGAYGVELKDTFVSCKALKIQTLELEEFSLADCKFAYRDSIFKNSAKGQYIITSVTFRLTKKQHRLHTEYKGLKTYFEQKGTKDPGIKDISEAVIQIRRSKLPDPKELGNSGSFFKNPVVSDSFFDDLQSEFPKIPHYQISEDHVKIPAGWLIDQVGLKGYRDGDAGVHKNQALVLVNYGNASGMDILKLARKIQALVKDKFQIELETEVNIF